MCQDRTDDMLETHLHVKEKIPGDRSHRGRRSRKKYGVVHSSGKYGFHVIQADLVARALMEPGKEAYEAVCAF